MLLRQADGVGSRLLEAGFQPGQDRARHADNLGDAAATDTVRHPDVAAGVDRYAARVIKTGTGGIEVEGEFPAVRGTGQRGGERRATVEGIETRNNRGRAGINGEIVGPIPPVIMLYGPGF
jgi:hypothetical protein